MSSACVDYVPALCTHRPSLLPIEWSGELFGLWQRFRFAVLMPREDTQTLSFRGRRSRNKVSVGEPAEGSLSFLHPHHAYSVRFLFFVSRGRCRARVFSKGACAPSARAHPASADSCGWASVARLPLVRAVVWSCVCACLHIHMCLLLFRALVTSKSHNLGRWISWHEQR